MIGEARNMPPSAPATRHGLPETDRRAIGRRQGQNPALIILTVLVAIYVLHWARPFFVPATLAVVLSCAFAPAVELFYRWRIPKAIGAALVVTAFVAGGGSLAYVLSDEAADVLETLPRALKDARRMLTREGNGSVSAIRNVRDAASQLENAAAAAVAESSSSMRGVPKVQVVEPRLRVSDWLWTGTLGAVAAAGQTLMVLVLMYFFLAGGDIFRRKLLKISGPALGRRKLTLQAVDEITVNIQRYLLVQVATSVLVGVATWLAFMWIGLRNAAVWGVLAGIFNTVPYVGPLVVTAGSAVVGAVQFGTLVMGLTVGAVSLVITTLEGYVITPMLTGRVGRLSPVVVFLSIAFWGWLWGPWGLLLGVPIVMMVKAVCDRVEGLRPIGELLGK